MGKKEDDARDFQKADEDINESTKELAKPVKEMVIMPKDMIPSVVPVFSPRQIARMMTPTPEEHVGELEKGGKRFKFVSGGYMRRELDVLFGFDWDFEIVSEKRDGDFIVVQGKLTGRVGGKQIVKNQYGGSKVKYTKAGDMMDLGNDYKAAATDALKKCAAELGICRDIYYSNEFYEAKIYAEENKADNEKEVEAEKLDPLVDEAKQEIDQWLNNMNTTDRMRVVKSAIGKITFDAKTITEYQWREFDKLYQEALNEAS